MSGYIITETPEQAFEAYADERVRYTAALTDGRGFIAYDGTVNGLPEGEHYEPQAGPWFPRQFPKRGYSTGTELFALVSTDMARWIMGDPITAERITGAVYVGADTVLLESDGWTIPLAIWRAGVTSTMDKRLEPAQA